jgi:hypothetical protein
MTTAATIPSPDKLDPAGAFLSFLIPGLGQIFQRRIGKGLLFFVGINSLFFYGFYLGQFRNVYFGDTATDAQRNWNMPRVIVNLYNRPQYAGQFWVGLAAWPAVVRYWNDPPVESIQHRATVSQLDKLSWWQKLQIALPEDKLNELQRDGDKRWDLGWVYTVIAGVLNVLVIYDALAGPAFGVDGKGKPE